MSPKYEVIIYWSKEDEAFIAEVPEVPELPGCMADGASYAEALAAAEVVIKEWIASCAGPASSPAAAEYRTAHRKLCTASADRCL